ncbi:hypothetical protein BTVI_45339 [Pitangus sulphuratus]|nr:hypothetical protein BTVI_45339 [Pitangus sulphuratus]
MVAKHSMQSFTNLWCAIENEANYLQTFVTQSSSPCTRRKKINQTVQITEAAVTSIEAMLLRTQLRWAGHISRMQDYRLPKIVLCVELATGYRKRGAPKRRYKDCLNQSLSLDHIDHHHWSTLASNREAWRHTAASFENTYRITLEKRQRRKNCGVPRESFCCAFCNRTCLSRIDLFNHQRTCSKRG